MGDAVQSVVSRRQAAGREASALIALQAKHAALQLLVLDPIVVDEKVDRPLLLAVHPA